MTWILGLGIFWAGVLFGAFLLALLAAGSDR